MGEGSLIRAEGLKTYFAVRTGILGKRRFVKAVDDVSLEILEGETLALVGESGSGKTTLGKTLLLIHKPTEGRIYYNRREITKLSEEGLKWYRREAQIIYQDPYSSINPYFSVEWSLREPLLIHGIKGDDGEVREAIYRALEEVKLEPAELFASKYPHMLSGGQRQRVAIARAMILKPRFIVADEPVSMLDASVRVEILELMREIQEKHRNSILYITHDVATVKYLASRIAVMYAGKIVEVGDFKRVVSKPYHPYTLALMEAIPDPDPSNRRRIRKVPPGEPPSLLDPPSGCRFHPRCPFAREVCKFSEPRLEQVEEGRYVACFFWEEVAGSR